MMAAITFRAPPRYSVAGVRKSGFQPRLASSASTPPNGIDGRLLAGSARASAISRRSAASSRASRRSRSSADTMAATFLPRRPRVMRSFRYATRLTRSASWSRASLTGIMYELYALYLTYGDPVGPTSSSPFMGRWPEGPEGLTGQSRLVRQDHRLDAVAQLQLVQQVGDVCLDRGLAHVQALGDLGIAEPARHLAQDLELSLG